MDIDKISNDAIIKEQSFLRVVFNFLCLNEREACVSTRYSSITLESKVREVSRLSRPRQI